MSMLILTLTLWLFSLHVCLNLWQKDGYAIEFEVLQSFAVLLLEHFI